MLGYLVLGVCLLAALLLAANWLANADPRKLARLLRYLGASGLAMLLVGRYAFAAPLLLLAVSLFRGWRLPMPGFPPGPMRQPASGQSSKVETEYLSMSLDHDTGVMSGEVLRGAYTGKRLAELTLEQLIALLSECHQNDHESALLLETYLDRTIGTDWRDEAQAAGASEGGPESEPGRGWGRRGGSARPEMSRDEACDVLGVGPEASPAEIKEAYRRLMQKIHPDQGGSTYLAAKINQAKDVLLGV
jgi:hypothetical protein